MNNKKTSKVEVMDFFGEHQDILQETNMAPENNPLEKEIPIGNHHF